MERLSEQLGRLDERTRIIESAMKENVADLKGTINDKVDGLRSQIDAVAQTMVTKPEFSLVQKAVIGAIALILISFMAQVVARNFTGQQPQVVIITPAPSVTATP